MQHASPQIGVTLVRLGRHPQDRLDLGADVGRRPRVVGDVDVHDRGDLLDERPVLLASLSEPVLRQDQLGHVEHQAEPVQGRASVVVDEHGVLADPHQAVVGSPSPVLDAVGLARLDRALALRGHAFVVRRVDDPLPGLEAAQPLLGGHAEQIVDAGADVHHVVVLANAVDVDHRGEAVDQTPVAGLEVREARGDAHVRQGIAPPEEPAHDGVRVRASLVASDHIGSGWFGRWVRYRTTRSRA